jgi:hypothetical protein
MPLLGAGGFLYSPEGWTCTVGSNRPKHVVSIYSHRRWRNIPEAGPIWRQGVADEGPIRRTREGGGVNGSR